MKITNEERIELLEDVKEQISNEERDYICCAISGQLVDFHGYNELNSLSSDVRRVLHIFPELRKHRPKEISIEFIGGWWNEDDRPARHDVLDLMITEIKTQLP